VESAPSLAAPVSDECHDFGVLELHSNDPTTSPQPDIDPRVSADAEPASHTFAAPKVGSDEIPGSVPHRRLHRLILTDGDVETEVNIRELACPLTSYGHVPKGVGLRADHPPDGGVVLGLGIYGSHLDKILRQLPHRPRGMRWSLQDGFLTADPAASTIAPTPATAEAG
jgi:hypothetical protein